MRIGQLLLEVFDHAAKVLVPICSRHFSRHGDVQSFEFSAKFSGAR
jgi:hypothetical protein